MDNKKKTLILLAFGYNKSSVTVQIAAVYES